MVRPPRVSLKNNKTVFTQRDQDQKYFTAVLRYMKLSLIIVPLYHLAKFLVPILSLLDIHEFTVHDSFSFAKELDNFDANCIIASLDAKSLFTNIQLGETIESCVNDLFSNNGRVHNPIKEDLKDLLKFAQYELFFIFDNKYYSQLDAITMETLLVPILSNAFLCHFEKQWYSDCQQVFCPNIYMRYVDMILLLLLVLMSC